MNGMMDVGFGLITDPLENECEAIAATLRRGCAQLRAQVAAWEPQPMPAGWRPGGMWTRRVRAIDPIIVRQKKGWGT